MLKATIRDVLSGSIRKYPSALYSIIISICVFLGIMMLMAVLLLTYMPVTSWSTIYVYTDTFIEVVSDLNKKS